jgi:hypothetical protein
VSINNKNFRVKNGLQVAGNATFQSGISFSGTTLSINPTTKRLQVSANGQDLQIAMLSDTGTATPIGMSFEYDGGL